ncbi:MAG: hypothetical protein MZU84_01295 [Sphingobacterium sp.]|nr:hypothetical protein [Sphingobacterium sp.]
MVGGEKNVLVVRGAAGTGKEATVGSALEALGYPPGRFLTLRGGTANPRPFDPLACGVTEELLETARGHLSRVELPCTNGSSRPTATCSRAPSARRSPLPWRPDTGSSWA